MENQAQSNNSNNNNQQPLPPHPPTGSMLGSRRAAKNAAFREKLRQMALPLAPLVQLTTGEVHPSFPGTLLNFWLLTDGELEALAHEDAERLPDSDDESEDEIERMLPAPL